MSSLPVNEPPLLRNLNPEQLAAVTLPAKPATLPQSFQILDAQDSLGAVKRVIKAMNLDEERFVPKQVSWFIAGSKEDGQRPRDIAPRDEQTRKLIEIYQAYEDQCQREG